MLRTVARSTAVAVTALLISAGAAVVAPPANAASTLLFHGAQYDSPGSDTGSTKSLNNEWISLVNKGTRAVNLNGYTVRDKAGRVYKFGNVSIAANGGRIWLHTGRSTANSTNRYWGSSTYIWNNTGDTAYLRNAAGSQIDACAWGKKSGRTWVAC